jgi:hypothetical protein
VGDRSQVAIKQGSSKVYLYGHWIGADIYPATARALGRGRDDDSEYLARIVFDEMKGSDKGETGFGIGTSAHGDVGHLIPVLDCDTQRVSWEMPEHRKKPAPSDMGFAEFREKALAGDFESL